MKDNYTAIVCVLVQSQSEFLACW